MTEAESHRVWTRQNEAVLDELEDDGVYRVQEKYIRTKMGNYADIYLNVYKWLRKEAGRRMEIPEGAKYPIWLTTDQKLKLPAADDCLIFELAVPESNIMIFDMEKWDYIVNYMYLPEDGDDRKRFEKKLKRYGISVESDIYLENFYPLLKQEMVKSWERLFDQDNRLSEHDLAICWELRKEWVVDYE